MLFVGHMIENGSQSSTMKSYLSMIKTVVKIEGYTWSEDQAVLSSLIQAYKKQNDVLTCRFPIKHELLELMLFELNRLYDKQVYLRLMYQALFLLEYYGLMRIGELTEGPHMLKASNIHVGKNKNKLLIVLYSSKTHAQDTYPQKITRKPVGFMQSCC